MTIATHFLIRRILLVGATWIQMGSESYFEPIRMRHIKLIRGFLLCSSLIGFLHPYRQ